MADREEEEACAGLGESGLWPCYGRYLHRKCWSLLHSLASQVKKSVRKQADI